MAVQIRYRVDFYQGSIGAGKAVFSLEPASTPFGFAPGEFVDPSGWTANPLPPEQHYQITSVEHQISDPGGSEVQHNIAIALKAVPR